jgi:hypothetical protein
MRQMGVQMILRKSVSSALVLSLLNFAFSINLPHSARADITSSLAGEKLFIKVSKTVEGSTIGDTRIKFEECQIENPTACNPIGARDYSISELSDQREVLQRAAEKEGAVGFSPFLGAILGTVGGAVGGVYAGGFTGVAIVGQSAGFAALGGAVAGALLGGAVVAVVGGIVVYKVVRHHKKKKAKKLALEADEIDGDVIEGQPVSIQTDIDTFAKSLSTILSTLPATSLP